jgi:phage gpG-like protein
MPKMAARMVVLKDNCAAVRLAVSGKLLMGSAKAGGHVIEGHAKVNASRGRPGLNIQTGALVGSINVVPSKETRTYAEVETGPSVEYARIHEFGGVIVPKKAKALSWIGEGGKRIFARAVHIPARPYLRPAVDEHKHEIGEAVEKDILQNLEAAT